MPNINYPSNYQHISNVLTTYLLVGFGSCNPNTRWPHPRGYHASKVCSAYASDPTFRRSSHKHQDTLPNMSKSTLTPTWQSHIHTTSSNLTMVTTNHTNMQQGDNGYRYHPITITTPHTVSRTLNVNWYIGSRPPTYHLTPRPLPSLY